MKTRNLYMVVENDNLELPSAIGTAADMMKFLCVKRSRFYELLKLETSDKLPFLVFKLDDIRKFEGNICTQH